MKTLLKIQSSLFGERSESARLADQFVAQWSSFHRDGQVITRDLGKQPVPHLTAERFAAFASQPERRTPEQQAVLNESDGLIAELQAAEVVVFAVPMYNFSVPSTLRAYFDHIARAGVTFKYTAEGAQGLVKGKQAYVFVTRGGFYPAADDTQTAYLKQFLGFIGITDVQFIHAEGMAIDAATREKSLALARDTIARLAPARLAA